MRLGIVSVVPSPYQRDLFECLATREDLDLQVQYLEAAAPDSPWAEQPLAPWESILEGRKLTLGRGRVRSHLHWPLPGSPEADLAILNTAVTGVTTQWLARRIAVPFLFWGERFLEHGEGPKRWIQAGLRRPLRRATGFLGVGSLAVQQYQRLFPSHPVWSLPYHCDLEPFRAAERNRGSKPERVVFLFAGQRIARKGFDLFLEAFRRVHSAHSEARALIAGRETPDSQSWISALPAETRAAIDDRGFVQPDELPSVFAEADVFVLPSRHDGWGVVVNQALGSGLPVLASDQVGAAVDLIDQDVEGQLHPAGQVDALLRDMEALMDPSVRTRMSTAAENRSHEVDPERGAARLAELVAAINPVDRPS